MVLVRSDVPFIEVKKVPEIVTLGIKHVTGYVPSFFGKLEYGPNCLFTLFDVSVSDCIPIKVAWVEM